MNKKIILLTVIGIYLTFALSSPIILAEDNEGSGLFSSEIEFEGYSEIEDPISPSGSEETTFKVKLKLNISSIAKWLFFNRRIGRVIMFGFGYIFKFLGQLPKANLTLSIEKPDWCQVELDKETVEFDYNNEFEVAEVKLKITLNETVPALEKSDIKITANYPGIGRIAANSNNTTISFMPKYVSNIIVEAEKELTISPLKENLVPINITNNGNGESSVSIQVSDPENWNITLEQEEITIGVGKTKQAKMFVTPPKGFDNETIPITFIPISTVDDVDDIHRKGTNVVFGVTFYNDGILEDGDGELDLIMILIIGIIVIIVIILLTIILKKRE
jgi:hypothetical protein